MFFEVSLDDGEDKESNKDVAKGGFIFTCPRALQWE